MTCYKERTGKRFLRRYAVGGTEARQRVFKAGVPLLWSHLCRLDLRSSSATY